MVRETVLETRADGVLTLVWNRPQRKNAFDERMWSDACAALREAREDDAVRAVVVTGAGEAFSAGQDLGEMARPAIGEDGLDGDAMVLIKGQRLMESGEHAGDFFIGEEEGESEAGMIIDGDMQ